MESAGRLPIFAPNRFWRMLIVSAVLVCGFVTRLYDLDDPPLDYASSRQLRSAIIARGLYYADLDQAPDWMRRTAERQLQGQETLEPEILESLTAGIYRLAGGEFLWIPRILSSLFWILGGLALYHLTSTLVSPDGAVISLLYYLFVPFGLVASRTFQPDPLMTALIVAAWLFFVRWNQHRSYGWALLAGIAAGGAILVKSTAVFFLFFGLALLVIKDQGVVKAWKDPQLWLIGGLAVLPALLYYLNAYFISGAMQGLLKGRLFVSSIWSQPGFLGDWLHTASTVLGHWSLLVLGLVGIFLLHSRSSRIFLLGGWLGYLVYGFGLSYYITTHSYYSLPAIPLLAVSLGSAAEWVFSRIKQKALVPIIWAASAVALVLGVAGGFYLYQAQDYRHEPEYYQKVASNAEPGARVIAISQDYGFRLAYYGWLTVQPWKENAEDAEELSGIDSSYSQWLAGELASYDYFIATRMNDLRRLKNLRTELYQHYPVVKEGGGYVVFDLGERIE
jgi:hypothetical protein